MSQAEYSIGTGDIHIKGAREHNLKDLELRIPRNRFVVITGISGSGKSALAFDTIYAEGYRKYIDSLSTKARRILDQVKRPEVDYIHGLSPVIAIEQRGTRDANPRSTVATVTEIADYARLLWAVCGTPYCIKDGGEIKRRSIDDCIDRIFQEPQGTRIMLLAPTLTAKPAILREELPRIRQRGFQRVRIDGEIRSLDERDLVKSGRSEIAVETVVDRLVVDKGQRSRLADSLELTFREGDDRAIVVHQQNAEDRWEEFSISQHVACSVCGTVYEPVTSRFFSYNHPDGACPECGGLGETRQFSDRLIVPDPSRSVRQGAIKPWRLGSKRMIIQRNAILKQLAEQLPFEPTIAWKDLPEATQRILFYGAGNRLFRFKLKPGNHKGEMMSFEGVLADLEETRRQTSSDGLKARLAAYQISSICPKCGGMRLREESLGVKLEGTGFSEFMGFSIARAHGFVDELERGGSRYGEFQDALSGLKRRLSFLDEVGVGYLTLDRPFSSLSGGESQRVRLATQLGMGLVGVIYVLDEPTIGLHPSDCRKLLDTLSDLRDRGNSIIVVEHDEETLRSADHLVELGPGAGNRGGHIIFQGSVKESMDAKASHIGAYLGRRVQVSKNSATLEPDGRWLEILGAACHNLKQIDVAVPVGLLTCITGVSGSGKSSLVNDILGNTAAQRLNGAKSVPGIHRRIEGFDYFKRSVRVDQSPIGRSPRSNPATYIKLFDHLRRLYAQCPLSRVRGYRPSRFSFNVRGGRCERCRGDGVIKLDMQFLNDVYTECPSCLGKRYNRETLDIRFKGYNIADVLDMTVDDALKLFRSHPSIAVKLQTLEAVGLGYIKLGQPANTVSGGEAQRVKLSLELSKKQQGDTLYLLDEPTTGLHWSDIQNLLDLLYRLRNSGNTVIIIEHQLDVIDLADWVIDLGPGGGEEGGYLLFAGTSENLVKDPQSLTAMSLRSYRKRKSTAG